MVMLVNLALRVLSSLTTRKNVRELALSLGARVESIRNVISVLKSLGLVEGKGEYVITELGRIVLEHNIGRDDELVRLKEIIRKARNSEGYIADREELEEEKNRSLLEVVVLE